MTLSPVFKCQSLFATNNPDPRLRVGKLYYGSEVKVGICQRLIPVPAGERPKISVRRLADCMPWRMLYNSSGEDRFKSSPQFVAQKSP